MINTMMINDTYLNQYQLDWIPHDNSQFGPIGETTYHVVDPWWSTDDTLVAQNGSTT